MGSWVSIGAQGPVPLMQRVLWCIRGDHACHKVLLCCRKLYQWFKNPQCLWVLNVVVQFLCIWSSLLTKRPTNISLWDSYCFSLIIIIIIALEDVAFWEQAFRQIWIKGYPFILFEVSRHSWFTCSFNYLLVLLLPLAKGCSGNTELVKVA